MNNITTLVEQLLVSFGLDLTGKPPAPDPAQSSDLTRRIRAALTATFPQPDEIMRTLPFSYAYLGREDFDETVDVVLHRARQHPSEREDLPHLFTAVALVNRDKREQLLHRARKAPSVALARNTLADLVRRVDRKAQFAPYKLPPEFHTDSLERAGELLGAFIHAGLYVPGRGFTREYRDAAAHMGNFEYMIEEPTLSYALIVTKRSRYKFLSNITSHTIAVNPTLTKRQESWVHRNPGVVVVNRAIPVAEVRRYYSQSTVLYLAFDEKERKDMERELGSDGENLIFLERDSETMEALSAHLKYVAEKRKRNREVQDFDAMLAQDVTDARSFLEKGDAKFYDIRSRLDELRRRDVIDAIVAEGRYELPAWRNDDLIVVHTNDNDLGRTIKRNERYKTVRTDATLPPREEIGTPLLLVTDKPLVQAELEGKYAGVTVLYVAADDDRAKKIRAANKGREVFVLTGKGATPREVANFISGVEDTILTARREGITEMYGVMRKVADGVKDMRDTLLFSPSLDSFFGAAQNYYRQQERYAAFPEVAQATDGVLMESCPTGGCFSLAQPQSYGCCGGDNAKEILIKFAIAYRRTVGEDRFAAALAAFQKEKKVRGTPWYVGIRDYDRVFPQKEDKRRGRIEF